MRNNKGSALRKPVMIMLHGSGSSAAIFGIQTHFLARELSKTFDLVYIDGPTISGPGPGVLPVFSDMPGYYRWLVNTESEMSLARRLSLLFDVVRYIESQLESQGVKQEDVVSVLGFSQGALVAMALLGFRLVGQLPWENLKFSVVLSASTTGNMEQLDGIEGMIGTLSAISGRADGKFPGHTVHATGFQDAWHQDSRRLAGMCAKETSRTVLYPGGHAVPVQRSVVMNLVKAIMSMYEMSKRSGDGVDGVGDEKTQILEALPPILTGGDLTQALAVLGANGIAV